MINNTDPGAQKIGAAISFIGLELRMNDSLMQNNSGLVGGCFYIQQMNYKTLLLLISFSTISSGRAFLGGVFGTSENIAGFSIIAKNNIFTANFGESCLLN